MTTQTQTAFSVLKAGIDKGIQKGIFGNMEEVLDLIQAYNQLVGENTRLESELGREVEKNKIREETDKEEEYPNG